MRNNDPNSTNNKRQPWNISLQADLIDRELEFTAMKPKRRIQDRQNIVLQGPIKEKRGQIDPGMFPTQDRKVDERTQFRKQMLVKDVMPPQQDGIQKKRGMMKGYFNNKNNNQKVSQSRPIHIVPNRAQGNGIWPAVKQPMKKYEHNGGIENEANSHKTVQSHGLEVLREMLNDYPGAETSSKKSTKTTHQAAPAHNRWNAMKGPTTILQNNNQIRNMDNSGKTIQLNKDAPSPLALQALDSDFAAAANALFAANVKSIPEPQHRRLSGQMPQKVHRNPAEQKQQPQVLQRSNSRGRYNLRERYHERQATRTRSRSIGTGPIPRNFGLQKDDTPVMKNQMSDINSKQISRFNEFQQQFLKIHSQSGEQDDSQHKRSQSTQRPRGHGLSKALQEPADDLPVSLLNRKVSFKETEENKEFLPVNVAAQKSSSQAGTSATATTSGVSGGPSTGEMVEASKKAQNIPTPHLSSLAAFKQKNESTQQQLPPPIQFLGYQQPDLEDQKVEKIEKKKSSTIYKAMKAQPSSKRRERHAQSVGRGIRPRDSQIEPQAGIAPQERGSYVASVEDQPIEQDPQNQLKIDPKKAPEEKVEDPSSPRQQNKIQFETIKNFKDNIMSQISGWDLFNKQAKLQKEIDAERDKILAAAFRKPGQMTEQESEEVARISQKLQCDCDKDPTFPFACQNGVRWFASNVLLGKIKRRLMEQTPGGDENPIVATILEEYNRCKTQFESLSALEPNQQTVTQIQRDLGRTFPKNDFFKEGNAGHRKLRKVLRAFACYDTQVDYVQGMNFVVGQLLMHCNSTLAFWLFVELIEECELRDIFQKGLPGLNKHTYIIRLLVKKHLPDLHLHFEDHSVRPEMYASDWIFSIFTSVLPETDTAVTAAFFSLFYKYKWEFFYKLILTILSHIEAKILETDDMFSILQQVKIAMSNKNDPYNYASVYQQQLQGEQKNLNIQDTELESIAGSVQRGSAKMEAADQAEKEEVTPGGGFFGGIQNMLGLGPTPQPPEEEVTPDWEEFPWARYLIKEDIIKKWKQVDMKIVNNLLKNFDIEKGQFINVELEKVSVVQPTPTYSMVEGLV